MAKVALGVCSSISIYKACEILRGFQKKDFDVEVIMTKNASKLISPLLFSALSHHKVIIDPFEEGYSERIAHISLAREISLLLVAPATANIIGKFASGVADDFLSTFFMAVENTVLIAPAMNEAMYFHNQTQENIQKLRAQGVEFIEPERGYLACEEEGWGRLAEPERIVAEGLRIIQRAKSLKGKKVLVTAGPTREFLDPVRFLSNPSSGKMGYELAREAMMRGADVTLISGPTALLPPTKAKFRKVERAEEMEEEVLKNFPEADIVIMASAVSDFRFSQPFSRKIKKQKMPKKIELIQTQDILAKLGKRKRGKVLVGFAAETEDMMANASAKLREKNLDLIVANNVRDTGIGFESDFNQVTIIGSRGKIVETQKMSKREISRAVLDQIEVLLGKKK